MICPGCKRNVHDGAKFCPRCGSVMPRVKKGAVLTVEEPIEQEEVQIEEQIESVESVKGEEVVKVEEHIIIEETVAPPIVTPPCPPPLPTMPPTAPPTVPPTVPPSYTGYESSGYDNMPSSMGYGNNQQPTDNGGYGYNAPTKSNGKVWMWVAIGAAVILLCVGILVLAKVGVFESISESFSSKGSRAITSDEYVLGDSSSDIFVTDAAAVEVVEDNYVDSSVGATNAYKVSSTYAMGFKKGRNYLDGEVIASDGRRFPFSVAFDFDPYGTPELTNVVYDNSNYDTKINMRATEFYGSFVKNGGERREERFHSSVLRR